MWGTRGPASLLPGQGLRAWRREGEGLRWAGIKRRPPPPPRNTPTPGRKGEAWAGDPLASKSPREEETRKPAA